MSCICELSGVVAQYGNKVSHSQRKTRRCFKINIRVVRFLSEILNKKYRFRVNAHCIRSVEKAGGIDMYMTKISESKLSLSAKQLRKKILEKKLEISL
ncbi:MAG: 50S ribosomal protein L28 [Rickettsiaceae bacterium]|nr:MAG: 50S ribosomal protein L28 [Rickettsiaceae bacterium]